ncbi:sensor domain-containing diguanylate cyclase [Niallia sp. 01092]|uniref:sensor domain-containing diguanylate cyclase n=1 Tax=unclassified Niallia TaxID=2837522 RepID=UPI003FD1446D
MDMLGHQIILKIKSRFFDIVDTESHNLNYEQLLSEMLTIIKSVLNVEEVALYSCKEWNDYWMVEATTASSDHYPLLPNTKEMNLLLASQAVHRKPNSIKLLAGYDLLLPLKNKDVFQHFFVIKTKEESVENEFSNTLLEVLCQESGFFLNKVQSLIKIVMEEKRYKQLFRVTQKFHSSMKIEGVLGEIIYTLQEVYPTFTYYLLLSHDNNSHIDLPIKDLEYDSENIAAMQAYVTGDIQFENSMEERRSILYAPLKGKQGVYGVLQVIAPNTFNFPKSEVEFITLLANTAGSALENAQLYQQSKKLVFDLQLINETSHRLNSNLRLTEMMTYMSARISSSFDAEEVGFILFSSESNAITVLHGSTPFFHSNEAESYIQYFKEKIKMEKDALFLGDFFIEGHENVKYKSIMAVPMMQTGTLKGFSIVMHSAPYHFSFDTFKLLQSLIHHSTLALTNSMLREELEKLVVTDHLTKLFSRNFLDEKIHHSLQEDTEGTFILIDIDNFKAVNDTYGHQVGDEIIIQVANIILENIRGTDIGARWGGEELAIYLPKVPLSIGIIIAERLVSKVRETSSPSVTISCGVSYWNKEMNDNYKAIFKRADKALYVAKESGKDRVVIQNTYLVSE